MAGLNLYVELTDDQAYRCAQFFKRLRFDIVRDVTPPGKDREEETYRTLHSLDVIYAELRRQGYDPR